MLFLGIIKNYFCFENLSFLDKHKNFFWESIRNYFMEHEKSVLWVSIWNFSLNRHRSVFFCLKTVFWGSKCRIFFLWDKKFFGGDLFVEHVRSLQFRRLLELRVSHHFQVTHSFMNDNLLLFAWLRRIHTRGQSLICDAKKAMMSMRCFAGPMYGVTLAKDVIFVPAVLQMSEIWSFFWYLTSFTVNSCSVLLSSLLHPAAVILNLPFFMKITHCLLFVSVFINCISAISKRIFSAKFLIKISYFHIVFWCLLTLTYFMVSSQTIWIRKMPSVLWKNEVLLHHDPLEKISTGDDLRRKITR